VPARPRHATDIPSFDPRCRCAFCVILGDTIPHVLESILPGTHTGFVGFLISRPVVVSVLTLGISYPLSLYRDIENLSKASALALVRSVRARLAANDL